ncbi:MAG: DEAD/DEAH box helicase [Elusimicrobia bacterium]|nr:DEAD/DEAH box helicase [Elusimicrobiota bacterium]
MHEKKYLRDSSSCGRAYLLLKLLKENKKLICISENPDESFVIFEDLKILSQIFNLKTNLTRFSIDYSDISQTLIFIAEKKSGIILSDISSLNTKVLEPKKFLNKKILKSCDKQTPDRVLKFLEVAGYVRTDFVYEKGNFSLRGGILDVWDFLSLKPFRIRFGPKQIDEIFYFAPETQLSEKKVDAVLIHPSPLHKEGINFFEILPDDFVAVFPELFEKKIPRINLSGQIILSPFGQTTGIRRAPVYGGNLEVFFMDMENFKKNNFKIKFFCENLASVSYLSELCEERNIQADFETSQISGGIISWNEKFALLKSSEIFGMGTKIQYREKKPQPRKETLTFKKGDYIVHTEYGIGKFLQFCQFEINGKKSDYISLKYADGIAHIPLTEISLLHKFRAPFGVKPKLSRLGEKDFSRVKEKVFKNNIKIAKEILETASKRKALTGISFKGFAEEETFAAQFPYEETEDQKKAIEKILKEMEAPHPMDHLLCGDVGFGKTEVAMRAAFRACWNGYQVAVVAPTTVLAQQHYFVFKERFKNFPVEIEMLSRFTKGKKEKILKSLRTGKIDILICTHAVFNEKIEFAKLGFVVLDEEHRFGVRQKEILKKKYPHIDILMMSATPIPRTLSMSLSQITSLSLIETPPPGRKKIETFIGKYNPEILKKAVLNEISRGGQVYYVNNRISSIVKIHEEFKRFFPEIKTEVAHAKMSSKKLAEIMTDFANRKFSVLISTIIIQSGLDIPNVNTLIVRESQKLGLAQMYQLRGRVGRGIKKAYCYFFYEAIPTILARKRFEFLEEFEELASGFHLAMQDLQLRGAGNLLGPQQHGFIRDVGSQLYFSLLEKAIAKIKNVPVKEETKLKLISGGKFIPHDYVISDDERFHLYLRISRIKTLSILKEFEEELKDRFGPIPLPLSELLKTVRLKIHATNKNISTIEEVKNGFIITWTQKSKFFQGNLDDLIKEISKN